jgi:anti-sigma regulatory factor (Ser/Thr protein kinase)
VAALDAEFDARPEAAHEARTVVRNELADLVRAPVLYDLLTVVSELVTNGVRHGERGPIRLRIDVTSMGGVFGEVANTGEGTPRAGEIQANGTGLGLHVVDAIAERWTAEVRDGRTVVRFVLRPS